jgi:hypothetical protein
MESTYQQTKYCLEKQAITNSRPPAPSPSPNNEIPQSVTNEALCILGNKQYCKNNPLPAPVVPTPAPKVIPPPAANWTTDSTCKNSYGLNARADMAGCKCNDGYIFNTAGTACVLAQSQSVPTKNIAPKPPKVEAQPKVESAQDTQPANQANIETPQTVQPPVEEKMQVLSVVQFAAGGGITFGAGVGTTGAGSGLFLQYCLLPSIHKASLVTLCGISLLGLGLGAGGREFVIACFSKQYLVC